MQRPRGAWLRPALPPAHCCCRALRALTRSCGALRCVHLLGRPPVIGCGSLAVAALGIVATARVVRAHRRASALGVVPTVPSGGKVSTAPTQGLLAGSSEHRGFGAAGAGAYTGVSSSGLSLKDARMQGPHTAPELDVDATHATVTTALLGPGLGAAGPGDTPVSGDLEHDAMLWSVPGRDARARVVSGGPHVQYLLRTGTGVPDPRKE